MKARVAAPIHLKKKTLKYLEEVKQLKCYLNSLSVML
jgi:hypothetical protein